MTTFTVDPIHDLFCHYVKTHIKSPTVVINRCDINNDSDNQNQFMLKTFPDIDYLTDDNIFVIFDDEEEAVEYCHNLPEEHVYAMVFSSDGVLLSENT